eukprot:CAMPEP_0178371122 /NCGR_PEP_ID=MMETSP0689_2-20121128/662_1 /TAXON_ID=160604 /ORGANISM="Amphidinium massartii, Strain CS-259" /LENGTH=233 /DNA_ID=CAMNT_0019990979 /DNA_START=1 /DNA_END=698 /DNA_ORIENTATION=-
MFRTPSGGFLCIARDRLELWIGDAIATSTNPRLEGAFRRNWWGFIGRKSADAALHELAGPELVAACRAKAPALSWAQVVTTPAGKALKADYVLHTTVPSYPLSRDPRPLPPVQASDFVADDAEAWRLLAESFRNIMDAAASMRMQSMCLPAIGCGCRGYPVDKAAKVGLNVILAQHSSAVDVAAKEGAKVPYLEIRILENVTFDLWVKEARGREILKECSERDPQIELWEGLT